MSWGAGHHTPSRPSDFLLAGAYQNARDWLMSAKGLTEDQAITLLTVAGDFAITQVVDGNCKSACLSTVCI